MVHVAYELSKLTVCFIEDGQYIQDIEFLHPCPRASALPRVFFRNRF